MSNTKNYRNYTIDKEEYLELLHFCRQYEAKKAKADSCYSVNAVSYDGIHSASNYSGRPTENRALRADKLNRDCKLIEQAALMIADPLTAKYILRNVTRPDAPYERLGNVPVGRQQFYELRRKFFYTLKCIKDFEENG